MVSATSAFSQYFTSLNNTFFMARESLHTDLSSQGDLSPLEKQVLAQYQSLAIKLNLLSDEISKLHRSVPKDDSASAETLLSNMRALERKVGLVYTLFRTAVYSLLLQNEEIKERRRVATPKRVEDASDE